MQLSLVSPRLLPWPSSSCANWWWGSPAPPTGPSGWLTWSTPSVQSQFRPRLVFATSPDTWADFSGASWPLSASAKVPGGLDGPWCPYVKPQWLSSFSGTFDLIFWHRWSHTKSSTGFLRTSKKEKCWNRVWNWLGRHWRDCSTTRSSSLTPSPWSSSSSQQPTWATRQSLWSSNSTWVPPRRASSPARPRWWATCWLSPSPPWSSPTSSPQPAPSPSTTLCPTLSPSWSPCLSCSSTAAVLIWSPP